MDKDELLGEWSEEINAFWHGANNCEWIAWKGSHQIFIYPCDNYPNPPSEILQHTKRIETLEDFTEAMYNGTFFKAEYKDGKAYWQDKH